MSEIKWRFPGNNFTSDNGLDTADMETFKEDPICSLAREVCQNSIDAKNQDKDGPVKVWFNSFKIDKDQIPNREQLVTQIKNCKSTWSNNQKISNELNKMDEQINNDTIECLRISDYNTTGLIGVSKNSGAWYYLVKGSGISDKVLNTGGSKGIGKYATFVNSYFNTVFYSTYTKNDERGYEGICKLCSANQDGTSEKTNGIGYYASDIQNNAIEGNFEIDKSYIRKDGIFGTDIFILGFKKQIDWKKDIISKVLDSFMVAIMYDELEVKVDDILLKSSTLKDIVYDDKLIKKSVRKSVISQYLLLTDDLNRKQEVINIAGVGEVTLFMLPFENDDYATYSCSMIRYPYMKIVDISHVSTIPCSALCIIGDNRLNSLLRDVENPQHTNWEFKRIDDIAKKNEVNYIYKSLVNQIKYLIMKDLSSNEENKVDLFGASEFIPVSEEDSPVKKIDVVDKPTLVKKKVRPQIIKYRDSIIDDYGDIVVDNTYDKKSLDDKFKPTQIFDVPSIDDRGIPIRLHPTQLKKLNYKFFCINKAESKYCVTFLSEYNDKVSSMLLYALDDSGNRYPVRILSATLNDYKIVPDDGYMLMFKLVKNQVMKFEIATDIKDYFSCEVKVYAYR